MSKSLVGHFETPDLGEMIEEDFYMGADDERKRRRESNSSNDGHPEEKHVACDDA